MTKQIPPELQAAVDLINSYNREPGIDADIVLIEQCSQCDRFFASLPTDKASRENNGKPSLCRHCSRLVQAQLLKARKAAYRERKRAERNQEEE